MSKLTAGAVAITLAGTGHTLQSTLWAASRVSRVFGGFNEALAKLRAGDFDSFVTVVQFGLGMKTDEEAKAAKLRQKVYETGTLTLVGPLVEYVLTLANGGRPLEDAASGEPEAAAAGDEDD